MKEFFGMNDEELAHCFIVGFQKPERWHGKILTYKSTEKDCSDHLFQFMHCVLKEKLKNEKENKK